MEGGKGSEEVTKGLPGCHHCCLMAEIHLTNVMDLKQGVPLLFIMFLKNLQ